MGRPRGFDESVVIRSAIEVFADRTYEGTSIDDLVTRLGVHRNSLYQTFGSKRGFYLAALRSALEHDIAPLIERLAAAGDLAEKVSGVSALLAAGPSLDLLLLAAAERAPFDPHVAELVSSTFAAIDRAVTGGEPATSGGEDEALTAGILGLRLRARAGGPAEHVDRGAAALVQRLAAHH